MISRSHLVLLLFEGAEFLEVLQELKHQHLFLRLLVCSALRRLCRLGVQRKLLLVLKGSSRDLSVSFLCRLGHFPLLFLAHRHALSLRKEGLARHTVLVSDSPYAILWSTYR